MKNTRSQIKHEIRIFLYISAFVLGIYFLIFWEQVHPRHVQSLFPEIQRKILEFANRLF